MKYSWILALCLGVARAEFDPGKDDPEKTNNGGQLAAAPPLGNTPISRAGWTVKCSSEAPRSPCKNAIDDKTDTFWQTLWGKANPRPPHSITIDMKTTRNVNGISVLPRQDGNTRNWIGRHEVRLSNDGTNWGNPVAWGTWWGDKYAKVANFETTPARYVRLTAITNIDDYPWVAIADLKVFKAKTYSPPAPGIGRWGATMNFPVIPVAGAVEPTSGRVVVWSAYRYDAFGGTTPRGGFTLSSVWDPKTGIIAERNITNTHHDMFCPGISMDGDGQIVVTGGNDAAKTTIYDSPSDSWLAGPDMKIPRGYQSSATTSDGRVFTIGGSWSGARGGKNGEIYDPKARTWTLLPKAIVAPMLTKDKEGIYKADNHAWLFGWKKGSVFQAGPSTAMNWYYTSGQGGQKAAGARQADGKVDPDSMNGNSVMFDAAKGKILTLGGSTSYKNVPATNAAHVLTIAEPGSVAQAAFAGANGMLHARTFHTSVVLPDGSVFITGGQSYANPFFDTTPQLEPELYLPGSNTFVKQQKNSIPRIYHSISLLLPDATVFNGGGGLCGSCKTNHFDAQIFTPNYLYDGNGQLATRPRITTTSTGTVKVGSTITFNTDSAVKGASLIRYGTTTHAVNTDQRRIPLTLKNVGTNKYSFQIPADSGIAVPGYWMLFALNSANVPSVAATIKVTI
ncbi:galactose oxidase precursor [Dactylonectria macrodidyma]|uniref:Galactose oxidase n=1 Tax=Dactylonectria macrodidyma TaxID=307937 RepID=A0A9P9E8B1_9HYPO|nr:galactose oxidase precursor [Dactylonectria macrodidyma]